MTDRAGHWLPLAVVAKLLARIRVACFVRQPSHTDYHLYSVSAQQRCRGDGFDLRFIWNQFGRVSSLFAHVKHHATGGLRHRLIPDWKTKVG